jgi:hypothetical protein
MAKQPIKTINDYAVIHSQQVKGTAGEPTYIVMLYRPDFEHDPFVVAMWWPKLGERSWTWGDYCVTLPEAMEAFSVRVKRAGGAA